MGSIDDLNPFIDPSVNESAFDQESAWRQDATEHYRNFINYPVPLKGYVIPTLGLSGSRGPDANGLQA